MAINNKHKYLKQSTINIKYLKKLKINTYCILFIYFHFNIFKKYIFGRSSGSDTPLNPQIGRART